MTEICLRSITNSRTWMLILVPTYSMKIFIGQTAMTTYIIPFVIGMLLARDLIVGISIPSSISLVASLFTRSVTHHLATNSLVTMLARLIVMSITRGPRDTSPKHGVTNPNIDLCQPNKHLQRHMQSTFIITQLRCDFWQHTKCSSGKREFHNLIVIGTCISHEESNSNILNDRVLS